MHNLANILHCLFPIIALVLLVLGIRKNAIYYIISSLWLSLIAIFIHFQTSGGQILGSYFNYTNAFIHSVNLIILVIALILVITHLTSDSPLFKYTKSLLQSIVVIGCMLLITNLWINAYFIENRMDGTPIMQVALIDKPEYCAYRYLFYKVATDGSVFYLCPNHYGLIPSIGKLTISPDFISSQLSAPSKKQMLLLQKKKS